MKYCTIPFLAFIFFASCISEPCGEQLFEVKNGMTTEKVDSIMGKADTVEENSSGFTSAYYYKNDPVWDKHAQRCWVYFSNDSLVTGIDGD